MATKRTNGHRNLEAFPLDTGLSKPQRAAAFLDWWAQKHPYDFAAYNEILKAIEGYTKLPRMDTEEVEQVRGIVGRAASILHEKFRRGLVRQRGLGARATVDSADAIRHKAVDKSRKIERDILALAKLDEIIDLKSIPDTPENRPLKQWYQRDVKGILKQIASPEYLAKMLPPAEDK
jgi:hypothetical protein